MKKFWLGLMVGVLGTLAIGALLGFASSLPLLRARADGGHGEFVPRPPIVLRGLFASRGEVGTIEEVSAQSLTLITRDGTRKTVALRDETDVYISHSRVAPAQLSKGQRILLISSPAEDGTPIAKLIRVLNASMFINRQLPEQG